MGYLTWGCRGRTFAIQSVFFQQTANYRRRICCHRPLVSDGSIGSIRLWPCGRLFRQVCRDRPDRQSHLGRPFPGVPGAPGSSGEFLVPAPSGILPLSALFHQQAGFLCRRRKLHWKVTVFDGRDGICPLIIEAASLTAFTPLSRPLSISSAELRLSSSMHITVLS